MLEVLSRRWVVALVALVVVGADVALLLRGEAQRRATADALFEHVAEGTTASAAVWWDDVLRGLRSDVYELASTTDAAPPAQRLAGLSADGPAAFGLWLDAEGEVVAVLPDRAEPALGTSMLGQFSHIDAVHSGRVDTAVWATDRSITASGRVVAVAVQVTPGGPILSAAFDLTETSFATTGDALAAAIEGAALRVVDPGTGVELLGAEPIVGEAMVATSPIADGLLELEVVAPRAAVEGAVGGVVDPVGRVRSLAIALLALAVWKVFPTRARRAAVRRDRAVELASLLELAPLAAVVVDPEGRIITANDAMCRLTAWPADQLVGREIVGGLLHPGDLDDETVARLRAAAAGVAPPMSLERPVRVATREGTPAAARMIVAAGARSDGAPLGMVLQVVDMRAEIRARAALDRARDEAARFSARVAHDLLNPLTAATGLAAMLRDVDLPAEQQEMVTERVARSLDGAMELVRRLAETAVRVGDEPWAATDLRELHERLQRLTAGMLAQTGGSIDLDVARNEVVLPVATVATVLANLVDNALKYRRDPVPPRIVLRSVHDPGRVHLVVEDNGLGVSTSELDAIFDDGHQLDPDSDGRGHGLAECRRLVEQAGGTIHAEHAPGGGLAVHVVLPWTPPTGAMEPATHADRAELASG